MVLKKNARIGKRLKISSWRRSALAIWRTAYDPSIYTWDEYDVAPAKAYLDRLARETGLKLTLTHFVSKAIAEMIRRHPEMNVLRRGGSLYSRKTIDLSFTVASDSRGEDLGAAIVYDAASKSLEQIARELQPVVREVKEHRDPRHRWFKRILSWLPHRLRCLTLDVVTWILFDLNLWSPIFGLPRDPFGCVLITNIGSLGLEQGFAALVPSTRIPMVIAVGAVQEKAIVREGSVVPAEVLGLYFTVDHRVVDAVPAGYMSRTLKKIFADPESELAAAGA
jgi:pyruvate/2-oxoglutarate dehydrogenase complex dihydrolipoamide acyltransferase (E2) component